VIRVLQKPTVTAGVTVRLVGTLNPTGIARERKTDSERKMHPATASGTGTGTRTGTGTGIKTETGIETGTGTGGGTEGQSATETARKIRVKTRKKIYARSWKVGACLRRASLPHMLLLPPPLSRLLQLLLQLQLQRRRLL